MEVTLNVKRYDPDSSKPAPYYQEYNVEIEDTTILLDSLIKVREEVDETLALRCSCRAAICGSCAMRVNGHAVLACKTKVRDVLPKTGNTITVEPAGNMPVIKDLVVEFNVFWDKVRAVKPWLQPQGPPPEHEYIAPNEDMLHLAGVMGCIMCGACVSDCTVLEVDKNFLGPAALAKSYRFVADPRDDADSARLTELNKYGGIWDCTRCMQCVQVCPKGVDPMGRIMALRDKAIQYGLQNTNGARHAMAFTELVGHSGALDELRLPIKTYGIFNIPEMIKLIPVGIRSQLKGKRPPIFHKAIPGVENVRRIFKKVENKR
ncbi:MAG: succinate dehydrogenase iron-sulfur subunit [SAR202 cluster bacterium]|nr:succinate dehydrogenase iron-sulfur subunit [SAR202 cluster bacterium]